MWLVSCKNSCRIFTPIFQVGDLRCQEDHGLQPRMESPRVNHLYFFFILLSVSVFRMWWISSQTSYIIQTILAASLLQSYPSKWRWSFKVPESSSLAKDSVLARLLGMKAFLCVPSFPVGGETSSVTSFLVTSQDKCHNRDEPSDTWNLMLFAFPSCFFGAEAS